MRTRRPIEAPSSSHADETRDELIVLIRPTVLPNPEVAPLNAQAEKAKLTNVQQMEKEVQAEPAEQRRSVEMGPNEPEVIRFLIS